MEVAKGQRHTNVEGDPIEFAINARAGTDPKI